MILDVTWELGSTRGKAEGDSSKNQENQQDGWKEWDPSEAK